MRTTGTFSGVRFAIIMTLVALFIATVTIGPAQAGAKCPCDFLAGVLLAKKNAAKINESFEITVCTENNDSIQASGSNDSCRIELEAEDESDNKECGYEIQCGDLSDGPEIDVEDNEFAMAFDLTDLTDAEFEACRRQIKFISFFFFGVRCIQ